MGTLCSDCQNAAPCAVCGDNGIGKLKFTIPAELHRTHDGCAARSMICRACTFKCENWRTPCTTPQVRYLPIVLAKHKGWTPKLCSDCNQSNLHGNREYLQGLWDDASNSKQHKPEFL